MHPADWLCSSKGWTRKRIRENIASGKAMGGYAREVMKFWDDELGRGLSYGSSDWVGGGSGLLYEMMALKSDACNIGTGPRIDAITGVVWNAEL